MSNFGFSGLRLVNPYHVAFQEARSAVHAHQILRDAQEFPSLADAIADCSLVVGTTSLGHRELQHTLRAVEYGGRLIRKRLAAAPVALLFGSEKFGLSNEDMSYCHWLLRIGTEGSMNLGQAVAVCLYELVRNPVPPKPDPAQTSHRRGIGPADRTVDRSPGKIGLRPYRRRRRQDPAIGAAHGIGRA